MKLSTNSDLGSQDFIHFFANQFAAIFDLLHHSSSYAFMHESIDMHDLCNRIRQINLTSIWHIYCLK